MHFNHIQDKQLVSLLQQSQDYLQIDAQIKKMLPQALRHQCQVICIRHDVLLIYAYHNMVATRLKLLEPMLLAQLTQKYAIQEIKIQHKPRQQKCIPQKSFALSQKTINHFRKTQNQLAHHVQLAQTIKQLIETHQAHINNN